MTPELAILVGAIATLVGYFAFKKWKSRIPNGWVIGPIINGKNSSKGMPLHPELTDTGWSFDFPSPDEYAGHVHYVTKNVNGIKGTHIRLKYKVYLPAAARVISLEYPARTATVSLHFQRKGDNWTGSYNRYDGYRWYSKEMYPLTAGTYEILIPLKRTEWISVMHNESVGEQEFLAALKDASRLGVVFGASGGRGHGVYADTYKSSFELVELSIV